MIEFEMAAEFDAVCEAVKKILARENEAGNDNPAIVVATQLNFLSQGIIALADQYGHFGGRPRGNLAKMVDAQSRGMGKFSSVDWHLRIHHECDGICNRCPGCAEMNNYDPYYGHYCENKACPAYHDIANKYLHGK